LKKLLKVEKIEKDEKVAKSWNFFLLQ
jgi:hypothetical protein